MFGTQPPGRAGGGRTHEALRGLKDAGIDFVSGLPDGWQRNLHELVEQDPDIQYVPVCNEGVGFSVCAGAWLGGKKTALIMENSGLRVAAEYIARISLGCGVPVVLLLSYRGDLGETEHWGIPHGIVVEPLLAARCASRTRSCASPSELRQSDHPRPPTRPRPSSIPLRC